MIKLYDTLTGEIRPLETRHAGKVAFSPAPRTTEPKFAVNTPRFSTASDNITICPPSVTVMSASFKMLAASNPLNFSKLNWSLR